MPISSSAFKRTNTNPTSFSSGPRSVGELQLLDDKTSQVISKRRIYANHEIVIGRDKTRCQWSFDDPHLSAKHLRIYTVLYDNEQDSRVDPLVYAEDLSRYGVYWNGSLIGKGSGGYLLSHEDKLRLSSSTTLQFRSLNGCSEDVFFDMIQEREMNSFRDEYILTDRLLGAGADGRVFMAIEFSTRSQVACKVIDLRRLKGMGDLNKLCEKPVAAMEVDARSQLFKVKVRVESYKRQAEDSFQRYSREVDILTSIKHPNIISVDKVFVTADTIYIFQDLITAGDLFSYMEMKNHKLLESEAAVILRQITIALQFLHQKFIVHRDLKPDNVMVTSMAAGARVVLTDFGSARRIRSQLQRMRSVIGTPGYVAPEVTNTNPVMHKQLKVGYTTAVDMWSLGVVAVLLLTDISAFSGSITSSHPTAMRNVFDLSGLQNTTEWKAVRERPRDFVSGLLVLDESKRMSADQALKHTWFSNDSHKIDFEDLYKRTIKNWSPRVPKIPVITVQKGQNFKSSPLNINRFGRKPKGGPRPVEPPYIPFPRKMHTEFWPTRKSRYFMSEEVRAAIVENWSTSGSINQANQTKAQPGVVVDIRATNNTDNAVASFLARIHSVKEQQHTSKPSTRTIHEAPSLALDTQRTDAQQLDLAFRTTKPVPKSSALSDLDKMNDENSYENTPDCRSVDNASTTSQQGQPEILTAPTSDQNNLSNVLILKIIQPKSPTTADASAEDESEEPCIYKSVESENNPVGSDMNVSTVQNMRRATALFPQIRHRPLPRLRSRSVIPKLRRLSSMSETRERKRRASIFDLENDDSSSDEDFMLTTPKRARTSSLCSNKSANDEERLIDSPDRMNTMLNIEWQQPKPTWHLPR